MCNLLLDLVWLPLHSAAPSWDPMNLEEWAARITTLFLGSIISCKYSWDRSNYSGVYRVDDHGWWSKNGTPTGEMTSPGRIHSAERLKARQQVCSPRSRWRLSEPSLCLWREWKFDRVVDVSSFLLNYCYVQLLTLFQTLHRIMSSNWNCILRIKTWHAIWEQQGFKWLKEGFTHTLFVWHSYYSHI